MGKPDDSKQQPAYAALAVALALAAGQVDGIAVLKLHVFVANMTGTVVLLGLRAAREKLDSALPGGIAIAGFLGGAVLAHGLRQITGAALPFVVAGLLVAFCILEPPQLVAIAILAAAMAMQNAALSAFGGVSLNTAFITGDLARFAEALSEGKLRIGLLAGGVVLAYGLGAALGALELRHAVLPLGASAVLLLGAAVVELVTRR